MAAQENEQSGHVIVCGLHGVGLRTVEQLRLAGVPVTVVAGQEDARLTALVADWGIPLVEGSSRLPGTLLKAGLGRAAAVICALADDLHTLETALLARDLRPDARVVVQIRNPAVGRALAAIDIAVLDVARLSAPSVVEACLCTGAHGIDLGGQRFVAATVGVRYAGTLRSAYGDLAPVAVSPAGGGELVVCPGRDHEVRRGDQVTLIGTPEQLGAAGITVSGNDTGGRIQRVTTGRTRQARTGRGRPASGLRRPASGLRRPAAGAGRLRPGHLLGSLFSAIDRRLLAVLTALLALMAVASVVLRLGYQEPDGTRMSALDAVYFVVETIATVGYGDFNFRQQEPALRMFAIVLMMLGAIGATVFYALLTNLYVSRGIAEAFGRRLITRLSGHVVVVGLGSIGVRVVEHLRAEGREVVVVDHDGANRYLAQARAAGARVLIADATLPGTWQAMNVTGVSAVAVLTSDDLVNLEVGLALRDQLGQDTDVPMVLRLFDRQLASTVERGFGFRSVRSTAALAAPWFVGAALGLDVLGTFYVGDQPLLVGRLTVAKGGGLDGLAMQDLSARTRVIAIARAEDGGLLEHAPRRATRLRAGDHAYLVGPYEELLQVLRRAPAPALDPPTMVTSRPGSPGRSSGTGPPASSAPGRS